MSNTTGMISNDGSIIITTTTHITVEEVMKKVETEYEGIVSPQAKLHHDRYYNRDAFIVRNELYEGEMADGQNGVLWVKARDVFVPYDATVMRESVVMAMEQYANGEIKAVYNGKMGADAVAYVAVKLYRDSEYYYNTYIKLADETTKKFNEKYSPSECVRKLGKCEQVLRSVGFTLRALTRDRLDEDLPKSTPTSVKNTLSDLQRTLAKCLDDIERKANINVDDE